MRQIIQTISCDRCCKPFESTVFKDSEIAPSQPLTLELHTPSELAIVSLTYRRGADTPVTVLFSDLCPKCAKVVENLVGEIRLGSVKPEPIEQPASVQA